MAESDWLEPPDWWKRVRPLRWGLGLLLVTGLASLWGAKALLEAAPHPQTQRYTASAADPVLLLDSLRSYASLDAVRALLEEAERDWTLDSTPLPGSPDFPPRNLDTIVVHGYTHLEVPGVLTLEFFNDRLYEALFAPDDAEVYAPRLRQAEPALKKHDSGRADVLSGARRVASNVDLAISEVGRHLETRAYVIWQDVRLVRQRDDWDAQFAAVAAQRRR